MGEIPERGAVLKLHSQQPAVRLKECPRDLAVKHPLEVRYVQAAIRFLKYNTLPHAGGMADQEPMFILAVDQLAGYYQWATLEEPPKQGLGPGGK